MLARLRSGWALLPPPAAPPARRTGWLAAAATAPAAPAAHAWTASARWAAAGAGGGAVGEERGCPAAGAPPRPETAAGWEPGLTGEAFTAHSSVPHTISCDAAWACVSKECHKRAPGVCPPTNEHAGHDSAAHEWPSGNNNRWEGPPPPRGPSQRHTTNRAHSSGSKQRETHLPAAVPHAGPRHGGQRRTGRGVGGPMGAAVTDVCPNPTGWLGPPSVAGGCWPRPCIGGAAYESMWEAGGVHGP